MFSELTDVLRGYWSQFLHVLPRLAVALVVLLVVWIGAGRLRQWLSARLSHHSDDPLLADFLTQVGRWVLIGLGLVLALNILGLSGIVGGLLAGASISAFIVGFAFKDIAENFLAGVILAFNRPFRVNDTIQTKDLFGRVTTLRLRTTEILTFDGRTISIPNSIVLKEALVNFTRNGFIRQEFVVGIDYDNDVEAAIALLLEQVRQEPEVSQTPGHQPFAVLDELAASTVNVKVFFWTDTDDYRRGVLELRSRVMNRVKKTLLANGYALPPEILELRLPAKMPAVPVQVAVAPAGSLPAPPPPPNNAPPVA